jgi:serine/threonine-protein kinase
MAEPGDIIAERYVLTEEIGSGAMGSVWRARDRQGAEDVAIKLFARELHEERALKRFEREASLVRRIENPHVVAVVDAGRHHGLPYLAMELLHGEDLRRRLKRQGWLQLGDTARVVMHTGHALAAAHAHGLVHRDIKPENLFLAAVGDREVIKVLDFGVAKASDVIGHGGLDPTVTGTLIGTPHYVSPEQARGLKTVGPASDLWSLGIVAFECLTGRRPFDARSLGPLIAQILSGAIPAPSALCEGLPTAVDAWFARALARDPEQRFPSATAMAEDLVRLAVGLGHAIEAAPPPSLAPEPAEAEGGFGSTVSEKTVRIDPNGDD